MHLDQLRDLCLAFPGATEDQPFGPDALVFKVGGKVFALTNLERMPPSVTLKCDPERAVELRERYRAVEPGWHMSKVHWNTVELQADAAAGDLRRWVADSYGLVVAGLPAKARAGLVAGGRAEAKRASGGR